MADKKLLKQSYKSFKPDMGVIAYKCLHTGKVYLGVSKNINADINGATFQLNVGVYLINANLARDWKKYGQSGFEISVAERLEYDKDEAKTDYTADLIALRAMCAEKLTDYELLKK